MLMNIWVKDKSSGHIHQVGTDLHDSLVLMDGKVEYYNLQNGCGTLDEYEFVPAPILNDYIMVTPRQLYMNRKLLHKKTLRMAKILNMKKKLLKFLGGRR